MASIRSAAAHPWARVIAFVVLGAAAMVVALLLSEPAGAADGGREPRPQVEVEPQDEGLVPVVAETAAGAAGTVEPITARAATVTDSAVEPVAAAADGATPAAEQIARGAAPVVKASTAAVEPVTAPVVEAAAPVAAPVAATAAPLVEAVAPVAEAVAPVGAPVVETLAPVLAPVADSVDPITAPVVDAVEPIVAPVSDPILDPVSTPTTAGDATAAADSESAMSMPSTEASATEAIASAAAGPMVSSDASAAAPSARADHSFALLPVSVPVERPDLPSGPAPVAPTGGGTDRSPSSGERVPTLQAVLAETAGAGGPVSHGVVEGGADALLWLEGRVLIFPG